MKNSPAQFDFEALRAKLKLKNLEDSRTASTKFSGVKTHLLNDAFDIKSLRNKSAHLLGASAIGSGLLLAPSAAVVSSNLLPADTSHVLEQSSENFASQHRIIPVASTQKMFLDSLKSILPQKPRPLSKEEEQDLEKVIENNLKLKAKATLDGEHLNTTYGYIGAEQHLKRFPGDSMEKQIKDGPKSLLKEGMAPGLGAWGYFARSEEELTPELVETEKWYAVVQTLYLPDWNTRFRYLRDWYKYRKVVIVNTDNGNAVVAAIADSGPAAWTGKQFGGSPEVMEYLGGPRYKKGAVLLFFLEDPENKVKLGPIEYNKIDLPEWAFHEI